MIFVAIIAISGSVCVSVLSAQPLSTFPKVYDVVAVEGDRERLGFGYASATGKILIEDQCVEGPFADVDVKGGNLRWSWVEDADYRETHSTTRNSIIGEAHYNNLLSVSGESIFQNSLDASSYAHTVVGRLEVTFPGPKFENGKFHLSDEAKTWAQNPVQFYFHCGDHYLKEETNGGMVYVTASLITSDSREVRDLRNQLKLAVTDPKISGNATAEATEHLEHLEKSGRLVVNVLVRGAVGAFQLAANGSGQGIIPVAGEGVAYLAQLRGLTTGPFAATVVDPKYRVPISYKSVSYDALLPSKTHEPEKLSEAVATLDSIDRYLADIEVIKATYQKTRNNSTLFFGPVNPKALEAERVKWEQIGKTLARSINNCDLTDATCLGTALSLVPHLEPAPPPGRVFDCGVKSDPTVRRIDQISAKPTTLLEGFGYSKPLTILVKGEWSNRWSSNMKTIERCTGPFPQYLQFDSDGRKFDLASDLGKTVLRELTGRSVGPGVVGGGGQNLAPDTFVIENWPADRGLTASLPADYVNDTVCTLDLPAVLIWQQDPRFNEADALKAVDFFPSP